MGKLKAGIIGLGVGEQHIHGYNTHPNCEVTALCDFSSEKYEMARQKYPHLKVTREPTTLINDPDIDVISIASFDNYHFQQIKTSLTQNKHVFVEKPVCLFAEELAEIRSLLTQKPNLKISSNLILRRCPRFQNLKESIQRGDYGRLFYVEGDYNYGRLSKITEGWRGKLDFYSIVYGGGIHLVDLLRWLTNDEITEVTAYGNDIATQDTTFKHNDMVVALLQFSSGIVGKISANFGCIYPHFHKLSIYGTAQSFENNLEEANLYLADGERQIINTPYPGAAKGELIYSFIDSIVNNTVAEVGIEDVFQSMSVCFAIEQAVTDKCKVKVRYI